jgi:TRAP transporter TAXI family solute receptor
VPRRLVVAVAIALVAGLATLLLWRRHERPRVLRIATGVASGTFYPLGKTLATTFKQGVGRLDVRVLETTGSNENLDKIEKKQADLALVSNQVPGNASTSLIAPLFYEAVQPIVRKEANILAPADLRGKRISLGPAGSGTETITLGILHHFGIARSDFTARNMTPAEASAAIERGELDAMFLVAKLRDATVDALMRKPGLVLLSLGEPGRPGSALEGIRLEAPYLQPTVIPERTYGGEPTVPIGTVSAQALLVAHEDLDEDLVAALTGALYNDKVRLATEDPQFARLSERFDPGDSPYPVHPGADRYYRRDDPSFIAKNADLISLGLTVGALLWSAATGLNAIRRRRRNHRIEAVHVELAKLATDAATASDREALRAARMEVEALRTQMFEALAHQKLDANDDFMVLQSRISEQLADLDRRLAAA